MIVFSLPSTLTSSIVGASLTGVTFTVTDPVSIPSGPDTVYVNVSVPLKSGVGSYEKLPSRPRTTVPLAGAVAIVKTPPDWVLGNWPASSDPSASSWVVKVTSKLAESSASGMFWLLFPSSNRPSNSSWRGGSMEDGGRGASSGSSFLS